MEKRRRDTEKKGCAFGLMAGSALRALVTFFKYFFIFLFRLMSKLGLWVPAIYAVFGLVLNLAFDFNPFDKSIDAWLYIAGLGITIACALVISFRNIILKPSRKIIEGYRYPVWNRDREGNIVRYRTPADADRYPPGWAEEREARREKRKKKTEKPAPAPEPEQEPYRERPKIYYSARERDTLIHEYSDRFEVFRVVDGKTLLHKVEYKNYDL